jgi:5-methylcytosine-specific restriction endonuclease McrA
MRETRRKEFSAKTREQALARCRDAAGVPRCEGKLAVEGTRKKRRCNADLSAQPKRFDHIHRDVDGGGATLSNCAVLCVPCHADKTGGEKREHEKAIRARRAHTGTQKPTSRHIPQRPKVEAPKGKQYKLTTTPEKLAALPRRSFFR